MSVSRLYTTHARVVSKFRGGRDGASSGLVSSHSTQISGFHLTSNKKRFPPATFIRNPQEARSTRASASATSRLRETRSKKRTTSKVSYHALLSIAIVWLRVLAYQTHAASPLTTRTPCDAMRHARAKSLGLLSPPHSPTTIARQSHHHS